MMAVTPSKQWIHFFLSDLCPPTSNILKNDTNTQTCRLVCLNGSIQPNNQAWLYLLEVEILESKVCFHNSSSFDSGPQHVLLGGDIRTVGYPLQVIQVALGGRRKLISRDRRLQASRPGSTLTMLPSR